MVFLRNGYYIACYLVKALHVYTNYWPCIFLFFIFFAEHTIFTNRSDGIEQVGDGGVGVDSRAGR